MQETYKDYKPSNTDITLMGDEVSKMCNHAPVYAVVNGELHVVECVTYEMSTTYLFVGRKVGE